MTNKKLKNIIGKKIILVPFKLKFVTNNYLRWMNDKKTTLYIEKAKQNTSLTDLYDFANKMIKSKNDFFFAITLKKNYRHIGNVRLGPVDFKLMKSNFGILIGEKNFRGTGIGTEVMNLIKDFSFNNLKLRQLIFFSVKDNLAATQLYIKTGFTLNKNIKKIMIKNRKPWKLFEWKLQNKFM